MKIPDSMTIEEQEKYVICSKRKCNKRWDFIINKRGYKLCEIHRQEYLKKNADGIKKRKQQSLRMG